MTADRDEQRRHRAHLARAVALAETARTVSSPNPHVGCVVARGDRVVGEGVTEPAGGRHAEIVALAAAGKAARGATAYVTLEPCAHHGRTPPCVDALVDAGVARVVFGLADPNPLATGGAHRLVESGVGVDGPDELGCLLPATIERQLEGFVHVVRTGRPHVTLKLAQTADGRLGVPDRRWITGPAARTAVHRWRANVDAVLVGSGTVLADDPRLDARLVPAARQPAPIVLDARLRTPPTAAVARPGAVVVTTDAARAARRRRLEGAGVRVVEVAAGPAGGVDLVAALTALTAGGVTTVLAEPGATLAGALLAAGLVDRLVLHVAPAADDRPAAWAVPPVGGPWVTERLGGAGEDAIVHLRPGHAVTASSCEEAA